LQAADGLKRGAVFVLLVVFFRVVQERRKTRIRGFTRRDFKHLVTAFNLRDRLVIALFRHELREIKLRDGEINRLFLVGKAA
jgi:hypothetical protein